MKFVGVAEAKAKFSEYVEASKAEPVCVLNHGKPAAVIMSMEGYDLEEVALMGDEGFWKMIGERRKPGQKHIPLAELEREVVKRAAAKKKRKG